jgi:hypothetical protein
MEIAEDEESYNFNSYITELEEVNGLETVAILNNHSIFYSLIKTDIFKLLIESSVFIFNN